MVVLELGKAGSAGTDKGVRPVLRGRAVVATLRASTWREAATAVVAGDEWVFAKANGAWSPRLRLTLDPAMPLEHQLFLLWLELVIARRSADGSGGFFGGAGGDGGGGGGD